MFRKLRFMQGNPRILAESGSGPSETKAKFIDLGLTESSIAR